MFPSHFSSKVINDPVHGHITLPSHCIEAVDTPQFQRLRDLKQLGTSYFVFPGASHNRFEHCLGVSHLAGKLVNRIAHNQPELNITEEEIKIVELAGLCHDLGHGPFSHAFEGWIHQRRPNWQHEEMSKRLLEHMIDENSLDYEKEDRIFIQELIGGHASGARKEKRFLFDIVANTRNSVDVDKFDYLARDCLNLGLKSSYDYSRLMEFNRVIDDEICFHRKEVYNIYEMFHTRYSMHKQVYTHRVGKAIELMICDAFTEADDLFRISEKAEDPSTFTYLTDCILSQIERSHEQELLAARNIIKNIRTRNLYKHVAEFLIPMARWEEFSRITERDIIACGSSLLERDIILNVHTLNYAMKERNPVDNVRFFNKWSEKEAFPIDKKNVSLLIPDQFSERYIRIFTRDASKTEEAHSVFMKFLKSRGFSSEGLENSTPSPMRPSKPSIRNVRFLHTAKKKRLFS